MRFGCPDFTLPNAPLKFGGLLAALIITGEALANNILSNKVTFWLLSNSPYLIYAVLLTNLNYRQYMPLGSGSLQGLWHKHRPSLIPTHVIDNPSLIELISTATQVLFSAIHNRSSNININTLCETRFDQCSGLFTAKIVWNQ